MAAEKTHINLIFIGHVDHGKSTTVGRLLFDAGTVDEQTMRKLKDKAAQLGKAGFEFAYVMDNLKEEQERGVTIDLSHQRFPTDKYDFTVIDAPGHRDFVKNMITGASQADAGVLVVAAPDGVNAQTREHVYLSKTLGVKQMIICVNKMDLQQWSESRFNEVKAEVSTLLKSVGFKADEIPFIPIAALSGDNVVKKSENMAWYTGNTLLKQLDDLKSPEKPVDKPLRMPIQEVYNIKGIGVVPVGRIETGVMKPGDKIIAIPGREGKGVTGEVKSIEMHHDMLKQAIPGDNVGVNVRGMEKKDMARGDVISHTNTPAPIAEEITAQIMVLEHPSVITIGYTPVVHVHTSQVACQIVAIEAKLNPATGEVAAENPDFIKKGDAAIVRMKPVQPLVIEPASENPDMARFAIRDSGVTVAAGVVKSIKRKQI